MFDIRCTLRLAVVAAGSDKVTLDSRVLGVLAWWPTKPGGYAASHRMAWHGMAWMAELCEQSITANC